MNLNNSKFFILSVAFLATFVSGKVQATPEINFSGFANVALTYSNSDELNFRNSLLNEGRDGLSFAPDSLLGLQMNAKLSDNFDAVGQIILQDRHDKNISNFVELAFLRYQINRNWSARIGRFSTNSYFFTDYRYVGHLLTWARPPIEMYSSAGSIGNMDGLQLSYTHDVDFGAIKLAVSHGKSVLNNDIDSGKVRVEYNDFTVLNVEFQSTDWRVHGAFIRTNIDNFEFPGSEEFNLIDQVVPPIFLPYAQQVKYSIIPDGRSVTYASLGGQYSLGQAEFIAELSNYNSDWGLSNGSRSGYLTSSYRVESFTPYLTFAFYNRERAPESIDYDAAQAALPPAFFQQLVFLIADSEESVRGASVDQTSISAGVKWDFSDDWSLKFQIDHFRISEYGSGLFTTSTALTPSEKITYNVANISLTTTF